LSKIVQHSEEGKVFLYEKIVFQKKSIKSV